MHFISERRTTSWNFFYGRRKSKKDSWNISNCSSKKKVFLRKVLSNKWKFPFGKLFDKQIYLSGKLVSLRWTPPGNI